MSTPEQSKVESPLETAWDEAHDRMSETAPLDEQNTIFQITAEFDDPDLIAEFREKHKGHLSAESVFFLEMSEAAKRANIQRRKQES